VNRLSYQEVGGQARGKIPDRGASKKLAGFCIRNLVKLVNLGSLETAIQQK
jgi:hypothetical protein